MNNFLWAIFLIGIHLWICKSNICITHTIFVRALWSIFIIMFCLSFQLFFFVGGDAFASPSVFPSYTCGSILCHSLLCSSWSDFWICDKQWTQTKWCVNWSPHLWWAKNWNYMIFLTFCAFISNFMCKNI